MQNTRSTGSGVAYNAFDYVEKKIMRMFAANTSVGRKEYLIKVQFGSMLVALLTETHRFEFEL